MQNDITLSITAIQLIQSLTTFLGTPLYSAIYTQIAPEQPVDLIGFTGSVDLHGQGLTNAAISNIIYLRNISYLNLLNNTALYQLVNITGYPNLNTIICDNPPSAQISSIYGNVTGVPLTYINIQTANGFTGSLAALTGLTFVNIVAGVLNGSLVPAVPGNNPNLTSFTIRSLGSLSAYYQTTASIGPLSNCPLLTLFNINNGHCPAAVVNYVLNQLLMQKQNGGAITSIDVSGSGMASPTGQGVSDKASLIALGVTVTTS